MYKELIDWLDKTSKLLVANPEMKQVVLQKEDIYNLAYQMAQAADVIEHLSQEK